jgi:hypothetical protein
MSQSPTLSKLFQLADRLLVRVSLGHAAFGPLGTGLWIAAANIPTIQVHDDFKISENYLDTFILFALISALGTIYSLIFFHEGPLHWAIHVLGIMMFTGAAIGFQELIGTVGQRQKLAHKRIEEWVSGVFVFAFTAGIIDLAWWALHRQKEEIGGPREPWLLAR